jgi:acylphosphatase
MKYSRAHVVIHGRVQGVFFRAYTADEANALGVKGWVRNLPNGSVEAVFEGEEKAVQEMIAWCRHGPPHAHVTRVDVEQESYRGEFHGFKIEYY